MLALIDPNVASMTSAEIANLVGSRHDNVMTSVERLLDRGVIQHAAMQHVKNHQGQTVEQYLFQGQQGKRDSIIVVAQLSPEFTAALVDRWQVLEAEVAKALLPQGDVVTMSSLEIAELTEKNHADVMRDIRKMLKDFGTEALNFESCYTGQNGNQSPCFFLPRDRTETLITGYSIPLRHAVVVRVA
jgi:phage regulator Rha-like protein